MCHLTHPFVLVIIILCTIKIARGNERNELNWSRSLLKKDLQRIWLKTQYVWNSFLNDWNENASASRTFGMLRRMKLIMPALMYKMGVMSTMLGFLTLFAIKGLIIGIVLLILQLSTVLAKLGALKKEHGDDYHHHKMPANIHVHIHGIPNIGGHHYVSSEFDHDHDHNQGPYSNSIWDKSSILTSSKLDDELYYYNRYKQLRDSLYTQEI